MIFRQLFDRESSTYTYLIADGNSGQAVIIDPVIEQAERDLKLLEDLELTLVYALETHVHADHVTGSGRLRERTGAKTAAPRGARVDCADVWLKEGDRLHVGEIAVEVLETPGHTDASVTYRIDGMLFTGDALLIRGTGRTDFQSGDARQLYRSVVYKIFDHPDHFKVFPGHDYRGYSFSTIGEEKRLNPRLANKSEDEFVALMANLALDLPRKIHEAVPANEACGAMARPAPGEFEHDVTPEWLVERLDRVRVLDVRSTDEYRGDYGHIPNAELMPLHGLEFKMRALPKNKTIVTVSRADERGARAANMLRGYGFPKVYNLVGGMDAWRRKGYPVNRGCG